MTPLNSELAWIDKNPQYYDSLLHAEAVKGNIVKRYKIIDLKRQLEMERDK